jgi:alpha-beta hydrolase superfamily lysophospholipase
MSEAAGYDEFGMLSQNAAESGLPFAIAPAVARRSFTVAPEQQVSAIVWGTAEPELVLLHGGGQNAHTWDTVALALGRSVIAIDLPGHGHSGRRPDRDYGPWRNATAVAAVLEQAALAAVTDDDAAEFRRRQPGLRLEVVPGAWHAVQSDQPLELTRLIQDFVFG